jgi:hypothetical protein
MNTLPYQFQKSKDKPNTMNTLAKFARVGYTAKPYPPHRLRDPQATPAHPCQNENLPKPQLTR